MTVTSGPKKVSELDDIDLPLTGTDQLIVRDPEAAVGDQTRKVTNTNYLSYIGSNVTIASMNQVTGLSAALLAITTGVGLVVANNLSELTPTASTARSNISAAKSGANSDITSLSSLSTPLSSAQGGTNQSSYTVGDILYASGSTALSKLADVATGNALLSGGVGVAPAWGKVDLTTHVSNTLAVGSGGTGASSFTNHGVLLGQSASAVASTTAGTSGHVLTSGGASADPAFASIATALEILSSTQGSLLYRNASAWVALGPGLSGQVLQSQGAGANPSWLTTSGSGTVTSVDLSVPAFLAVSGNPVTTSGTLAVALATQVKNRFFVGPTTGSDAAPTFRIMDVADVPDALITNAKLANMADVRFKGNVSGGAAAPSDLTITQVLDAAGSTQGQVLYRSGAAWTVLNPGTAGEVLTTGGAAANPSWTAVVGTGTVTSIAAGAGIVCTPDPITTTGTVALSVPVTAARGGTGLTSGTSGGLLYFSGSTAISSSALLAANQLVLGGGAGTAPATLGSLGTTSTVLHGNAGGAPSFGAVALATDVSGALPVANGGTGLTAGTSGGILAYTATGTLASSAALVANQLVLGGGAGVVPLALGSLGTTAQVLHGNAAGAPTFGAVVLTTDVSGALPVANGGTASTTAANARTALGVDEAANSEFWTGTDTSKVITARRLFAAAAPVALIDAATIASDFNTGINFTVTLGGNRTLGNPTNQKAGQSGTIRAVQDGTGSRTLAYASNWKFAGGAPVLSTAASTVDMISYAVHASGTIYATLSKAFA